MKIKLLVLVIVVFSLIYCLAIFRAKFSYLPSTWSRQSYTLEARLGNAAHRYRYHASHK